ncbi:MAG TPA: hypothetical protein VFM55_15190 [Micromonosporaceae bacterium]|nr:hypothetical protein [Micromonosporaceae bacterium]
MPAAAITVLIIAVTVSAATQAPHENEAATATPGIVLARGYPAGLSASPTTADLLSALANTIRNAPTDHQTGRYTYHHLRRWILDTTGTPAPRPNTPAVFAVEIHRWEATDGSGLGIYTEPPPAYDLAGAEPDYLSTDGQFAGAPTTRTAYRAGNLSSPIVAPLAIDPTALARQLAFAPLPDGPQSTLRAIDELYTAHYVSRPTRAAVLQVLAGVDSLSYQPDVTDRLGRHGIGVSLDADNVAGNLRFSLVFDPDTGQLLASSQLLVSPHRYLSVKQAAQGRDVRQSLPAGLFTYYTLFVDQGRRADLT